MMIDRILDEYRQGNPETRLGLFMYYRELRDEFFHMEQEDRAVSPEECAYPACKASLRHRI